MTPRGGPTLDFSLFGRYFLDLAVFYPGAFLCLAPLWEHVKAPRRTAVLAATLVTVICLVAAAFCAIFELDSNILLLPTLLAAFWLLRWRVGPEVSVSQTAFLFAVSGVMTAVCTLLSTVLNARAEVGNDAPACLVSTSLLKLGLSAVLCIIFWFTAVQWSRWLLREYRGEAFWQSAWPLPTIYAAFLVFCMPLDPAVVLINRLMIISVLAVTISLLGIFLLLYEMYQVAREYTRSAQLDRENQLLAVESRRYTELRAYMEQTRHLRHDFRQHLHVIAGLTEAGQVDELKNYLHQYESELSEERPTLCANPAVDALAGHYDHEAHSLGVPVDWRLELPRQLAIPEADFCMMLGNLLENALHASQKLPPEQRQVKVLARMLSPAMLGLLVENRYDGVLKRQHLNALNIAAQYLYLKENPNADFIPKTYIFGAKAAPGYYMAKQMIRMICKLGDLINNDPAVRDKLRVVYLEEYCVSLSEHLMPAAEVSEQISLAGTEASGTGNMKFMLNGAITLGTLDGANVEIADAAGKENELIFGMLTPEVNNLKQVGYHPNAFITGDDVANAALNFLERGWNGENFHEVTENLRSSDPYMVMADFKDYRRAQADLQRLYADREHWAKMSLKNIANSGIFSADRAVLDYARDIWHASAVK